MSKGERGLLLLGAMVMAWAALGCISTGPQIPIPKVPEQMAQKTEIPEAYVNDTLREEVLASLARASSRPQEVRIACVPDAIWEYDNNFAAISKGFMGSKDVEPEIRTTFGRAAALAERLEESYARFQDFRRKVARVPHDVYLQRLTAIQGLTAMYYGRALMDYLEGLERAQCSVAPLDRLRKGARNLMSNLVDGQIPAIMKRLKQNLPAADMALLDLEFAVVSGRDVTSLCSTLVAQLEGKEVPSETSVLTWCGYAAFVAGDTDTAARLWRRSGQSVHDPDAASYALGMIRVIEDDPKLKPVTVELDKE
jgi:hypothetical protein